MTIDKRVKRCEEDDALFISKIEIDFAIPVYLTQDKQRALAEFIGNLVKEPFNQPEYGLHWLMGCGAKPSFSQADQAFLGKAVDPDAPEDGEPSFDDSVFYMNSHARPFVSDKERERELKRRARE